jgi:hypothetical protein
MASGFPKVVLFAFRKGLIAETAALQNPYAVQILLS